MGLRLLKPIAKRTLQDSVHEQLKHALMSGQFEPGASMTLRGIAAQFGTSMMPIRDAVRRLVSDGALEMVTSRKIRVPLLSVARYESVLRLRQLLEGEAAARAATRVAGTDVQALVELNGRVHAALNSPNVQRFLEANREFHFAVYERAADPLLLALIERLWLLTGPYLGLMKDAFRADIPRGRSMLAEHDALLKALRTGDAEASRIALNSDIQAAAEVYRPQIKALSARAPARAPRRRDVRRAAPHRQTSATRTP
jgi:DNA-binding GntR family transcriptional regulator